VPHHVIADGAAASLMAAGRVSAVFVGADRIAANGDTANKIGTYALALAASHHGVPLYVVAPTSTIDAATASGDLIPVERRDEAEVLTLDGAPLAPAGSRALNPAFDVTPAALIAAIVTERGVLRPPYREAIARVVDATPATAGSGRT
jgi:methylthioribose-1-phosphate isomerase